VTGLADITLTLRHLSVSRNSQQSYCNVTANDIPSNSGTIVRSSLLNNIKSVGCVARADETGVEEGHPIFLCLHGTCVCMMGRRVGVKAGKEI